MQCTLKFGGGKLHFSEILHTHFHLLTPPLIMYFMQKVIPPILLIFTFALILLYQVRPFITRRLVKEDNGRPVRRIYGTGTISWQNSALDRRKFYDTKF